MDFFFKLELGVPEVSRIAHGTAAVVSEWWYARCSAVCGMGLLYSLTGSNGAVCVNNNTVWQFLDHLLGSVVSKSPLHM
jgi:hypothetical protein